MKYDVENDYSHNAEMIVGVVSIIFDYADGVTETNLEMYKRDYKVGYERFEDIVKNEIKNVQGINLHTLNIEFENMKTSSSERTNTLWIDIPYLCECQIIGGATLQPDLKVDFLED
jgi:hypothetical protein